MKPDRFILFPLCLAMLCPSLSHAGWARAPGPEGGTISALLAKGDTVFAGTPAGLYRTRNGGATWEGLPGLATGYVYQLARQGGNLYAVVDNSLLLSVDGGENWGTTNLTYAAGMALAAGAGAVFACEANQSLAVSQDSGRTWSQPSLPGTGMYVWALAAEGARALLGTWSQGILLSEDKGNTWRVSLAGDGIGSVRSLLMDGWHFLAGTDSGLYQSSDGGQSWARSPLDGEWPDYSGSHSINGLAQGGGKIYASHDYGLVHVSGDGGKTWSVFDAGVPGMWLRVLAVEGGKLFTGDDAGGVRVYADSGNGKAANTGLRAMPAASLLAAGGNLVLGLRQGSPREGGIFLTGDGGLNWTHAAVDSAGPLAARIPAMAQGNGRLYASAGINTLLISDDDGAHWKSLGAPPGFLCESLAARGDTVFAGFFRGAIRYSRDKGATWIKPASELENLGPHAIAFHGSDVIAASDFLMRSGDGGDHWDSVTGLTYAYYSCLMSMGSDFYAGTGLGILVSHDGGRHWESDGRGLPDLFYVNVLAAYDGVALAGGGFDGVYYRRPGDSLWRSSNAGLGCTHITGLAVQDGWLYAATDGGGVWKRPWEEATALRGGRPPARGPRQARG